MICDYPIKQASALLHKCAQEFSDIVRFNRMMRREPGNTGQILLQSRMLNGVSGESNELLDAKTPRDIVDGLCDVTVVAAGFLYVSGNGSYLIQHKGYLYDPEYVDVMPTRGGIYNSCAAVAGDTFAYAVEHGAEDCVFLKTAAAHAKDAIWRVAAYCAVHGIDLKKHLAEVNRSNFSKFCRTYAEATETVNGYWKDIGIRGEVRETGDAEYPFAVYVMEDGLGKDSKYYLKDKLLKCISFQSPVFELEVA